MLKGWHLFMKLCEAWAIAELAAHRSATSDRFYLVLPLHRLSEAVEIALNAVKIPLGNAGHLETRQGLPL